MGNQNGCKEYRIFNKLDCDQKTLDELFTKRKPEGPEERTDFYIFPYNGKFSKIDSSNYGLKFRNVQFDGSKFTASHLELKVKHSSQDGVESWSKVISQHIATLVLMEEDKEGIKIGSKVLSISTDSIINTCIKVLEERKVDQTLIEPLKDSSNVIFSLVNKNRISRVTEDAYFSAYTFNPKSSEAKVSYFHSLCVEGSDLNESEIKLLSQYIDEKSMICGYPEALLTEYFK
jgi:hypothetical protein